MKEDKERYTSDIESYYGTIPLWLILVIITLLLWAIYYVIKYWGGLGPGIN
jgi:hypothetical protein